VFFLQDKDQVFQGQHWFFTVVPTVLMGLNTLDSHRIGSKLFFMDLDKVVSQGTDYLFFMDLISLFLVGYSSAFTSVFRSL